MKKFTIIYMLVMLILARGCFASVHFMENNKDLGDLRWLEISGGINNINIVTMLSYGSGKMYVGTSSGVFSYNKEDGFSLKGLEKEKILTLQLFGKDLYAGTKNGLFKIEVDGKNEIKKNPEGKYVWQQFWLSNNNYDVALVLYSNNDYLYAGTQDGKIYQHKLLGDDNNDWINIGNLKNKNVHALCELDGYLYAGTDGGGVYKIKIENGKDLDNKKNTWQDTALTKMTTKTVLTLTKNNDAIYAGTYGDGVYKFNTNENNWSNENLIEIENKYVFYLEVVGSYLYAGTAQGVYRYEVNLWNKVSSLNKRITCLAKDKLTDAIYIANGGLSIVNINSSFDKRDLVGARILYPHKNRLFGVISNYGVFSVNNKQEWFAEHGLEDVDVNVFCAHKGILYAGTSQGVYQVIDIDWKEVNDMYPLGYISSLCSHAGNLYAGTIQSIYKLDSDKTWRKEDGACLKNNSIKNLYSTGKYMYLVTGKNELVQVDVDNKGNLAVDLKSHLVIKFPEEIKIQSVCLYDQDYLYIGTSSGIFRVKMGSNELESYDPELDKKSVISLSVYNGCLYAGTKDEGVFKKSSSAINEWSSVGLCYERITSMITYANKLCVGTEDGRILVSDGDVKTEWYNDSFFGNDRAQDIYVYGNYLYVISEDGSILRNKLDSKKWTKLTTGLIDNLGASVLCAHNGGLYVGVVGNWVYRLQNNVEGIWDLVGNKLKKQKVLSLASYKGYLYASTTSGINKLDRDEKTKWTLILDDQFNENSVGKLFASKNNLYAFGVNNIYVTQDGESWRKLVSLVQSPKAIYEYQNSLYVGTNDGVFKLDLNDRNGSWENVLQYRTITSFYSQGKSLFAGVADGRIFATQNNGMSWVQVDRISDGQIFKFFSDNNDVFAITSSGLYKSIQ